MNRHWIELVHPLSGNYFFHLPKKVGPFVHPTLYKRWYFTFDYRDWIDTIWTLYTHCRKITFSTVEIRLGQLFTTIVPTLVINSGSSALDQHLTDRHSWQSVMISIWEREVKGPFSSRNIWLRNVKRWLSIRKEKNKIGPREEQAINFRSVRQ